ncbi:MAG TPA: cache domain-containing protein [Candidatus Methylomirabilis sp.]|nr:cache domain-containing protein [Candidatus Methylomirabilis sp.]
MKVQTKFNLAIISLFTVLAVGIAIVTVNFVNTKTIREAENRVRIYARTAWEIHESKIGRIRSASEILARDPVILKLLTEARNARSLAPVRDYLETVRRDQGMDILNIAAPDGTVILRTRPPYTTGDTLAADSMIKQVLTTGQSVSGDVILELERLDLEGVGLLERCMAVAGESRGMLSGTAVPVRQGKEVIGIIQAGSLLNGAVEKVDRIRDAVFADERYRGKPVGTATIFMADIRISTNVMDSSGRRAVGTRASPEVTDRVLRQGQSWTGKAYVVDTWYLSQYDPIRDPEGKVIGMLYVGELEQKYLDLRTRAVAQHLAIIVAGLFLALLVIYGMVRGILRPVQKLAEATQRLSSGDLNHRVEVEGRDEVGALSASFNRMAETLAGQRQEIEIRQRELEDLSSELKSINTNYLEMLGFVAHELKNPLASAMMSLYTVKDGYLGAVNPAQQKSLDSVAQSLDYFHDMVKNYLDLSRLEKGELEVVKQEVPLHAHVVRPVLEGLERGMRERRMVLQDRIPDDVFLKTDGNLLRIVYDNLLSNALKYGREGGSIVLDLSENHTQVVLSVRNDGAGIPPEQMSRLFEKFSRLDTPECVTQKGSGLGLYICKEIVRRLGGEIWADSKAGEWVRFSFSVPK